MASVARSCFFLLAGSSLLGALAYAGEFKGAVYPAEAVKPYPSARTGGNYLFNYYLPPASSSSPWWVNWSSDGSALLFSMHGSLWSVSANGGVATEIKSAAEYLSSPTLSPDGRYLAYTAEVHGQSINLRILDLVTGHDVQVTDDDHITVDPAWSPDSRRLAFVSTRQDGHFHIFTTTIQDGKPQSVTSVTHIPGLENTDPDTGRTGSYTSPSWTADGKQLMFVWNRGANQGSGGLWTMDAREHGIRSAKLVHREESVYRLRPDVSPDGSRIVYSSYSGEQFNNLYLLPTAGGVPYKLSFDKSDRFQPQWSPDGRKIAYVANRSGASELRILDVFSGKDVAVKIGDLAWIEPRSRLTVRTIDANSGEPLNTRVYVRAADGKSYAPNDEYHRVGRRLGEHYFHGRGTFELELPAGLVEIEVHRGFEFYPVSMQVELAAGDQESITIPLRRMHDMSASGWHSGDNHVHMNYAGNLRNSPANLVGMAEAEDVAVVNALVANKYTRIIDHQYFTGKPDEASTEKTILVFNEEYRPPFFGHISLLGLSEHLIAPFAVGMDGTAIESLYPSNTDVLRTAAQQNAIGGYVHPFRGSIDPIQGNFGGAKAFPVDLALGTLGFHELTSQASWGAYTVWHHALNAGFRVPVVGGEDAITDLHRMYILGQLRTYAKLDGERSWENWLSAIQRGNTIVTNGPLLSLNVEKAEPGDEHRLSEPGIVRVTGSVHSIVPLDQIEVLINGKPKIVCSDLCTRDPDGAGTKVEFELGIPITRSSWVTLQAYTDRPVHPVDDHFVQATTNAVWVTVNNEPIRNAESILYFRRWIQELIARLDLRSGWRGVGEKKDVLDKFYAADQVLEKRLQEARQHCLHGGIRVETLVELDRRLREFKEMDDETIERGVWIADACSGPVYSTGDDVVIPAASSIKAALLIEFFAEFAERLDEPFEPTTSLLRDRDSPAFRHFDHGTLQNIRTDLIGLTARELGEAMISKKHVTSNAAYNAAANLIILVLGGPEAVTRKIRDRHAGLENTTIARYMLANRYDTGDNTTTLADLGTIHRSLALRDIRGINAETTESICAVLEIESLGGRRQFYKGGSLSSDPQVRIEAGWLQHEEDILLYAVAAHRKSPPESRDTGFTILRSQVAELSEIVKSAR